MKIGQNKIGSKHLRFGAIDENTFKKLEKGDTITYHKNLGTRDQKNVTLTLSQDPTIKHKGKDRVTYEMNFEWKKNPLYAIFRKENAIEVLKGWESEGIDKNYSAG